MTRIVQHDPAHATARIDDLAEDISLTILHILNFGTNVGGFRLRGSRSLRNGLPACHEHRECKNSRSVSANASALFVAPVHLPTPLSLRRRLRYRVMLFTCEYMSSAALITLELDSYAR
jgi:hypothetical protein